MARFTIQPVEIGRRHADTANFLYLTEQGREIEIVYRLWVLKSETDLILVDTGPPLEEARRRGITNIRSLGDALCEVGVEAGAIKTILLTHLHWDHASNAAEFPNAQFHAQLREIEFFQSRQREHPSIDRFFSHHQYLGGLIDSGRISPIHGEQIIVPGIRTLPVGGHTPGSQMIMVDTPEGLSIITGDAIPLRRNYLENIPSGIIVDVFDAIAALERVRSLGPRTIYPAHDLEPCFQQ